MTQGRGDGKEWVTSFKVSYSMDDYNEAYVTDQYGNHRVRKSGIREYVWTFHKIPSDFFAKNYYFNHSKFLYHSERQIIHKYLDHL